ncbi:hypothetical protein AAV94_08795 [Lampropedia cohaerens]|uniref:Biosynthetic peptidoglycan transglycosylase n=1 Tax=Lampropedia cohaerens TaxID=1610491 RepID=A0A0U1PZ17_9BURK|nr:monofunctional biosynthetic peptidoglycan transglycosylase [Lampropedia cohaerens]KKW67726.1 hypothetical protein AAV94_08795 [Lampropedia cohaerens]
MTVSVSNRLRNNPVTRWMWRWLILCALAGLCLQLYFLLATLSLNLWQPPSTAFQRTAIWQNLVQQRAVRWQHTPVSGAAISDHARRAVIASEDSLFFSHRGVDWQALRNAWQSNLQSERVLGGSTITQQLAKNLFLSGERSFVRKGQELLLAWMLEAALPKQRILDIYLNQIEWGDSIYGIEAAARHYFGTSARQLSAAQAAKLAVLLPSPRRLGANPHSRYVNQRTRVIVQRMGAVELPGK